MASNLMQRSAREQVEHVREQHARHRHNGVNMSATESWISGIGGGLLAAYGLWRRDRQGIAAALAGGGLIYRGATRHSYLYQALGLNTTGEAPADQLVAERVVTVDRSPQEVYQCVRNLEQLPRVLPQVEEVTVQDVIRSHWVVQAPGQRSFAWDAQITSEQLGKSLSWQASSGSLIHHQGTISLTPAPGGRGTEVRVRVEYTLPLGRLGDLAVKPLGFSPDQQVREGLRYLKAYMETGETPTIQGQSKGARHPEG